MISPDSAALGVVAFVSLCVAGYMWRSGGSGAAGGRKRGGKRDDDDDDRTLAGSYGSGSSSSGGGSGSSDSQFQRSSYYYAHKGRDLDEGVPRVWDGKASPKLLRRAPSAGGSPGGAAAGAAGAAGAVEGGHAPPAGALSFSKYAFSDEGAKIKLYITSAGLDAVPSKDVAFTWTKTSLRLTVAGLQQGKTHMLDAPALFGEISKASFKQKGGNRIVVTLHKAAPEAWVALHKSKPKKAVAADDDHAYA